MSKRSFEKLVHILRLYLEKVTKPAIVRKQMLLVYHVVQCPL